MCLSITATVKDMDKAINKHKKIANKDIIVYKRLIGPKKWANKYGSGVRLKSPHKGFSYEMGVHYFNKGNTLKERFGFNWSHISNILSIHEGLHAYTTYSKAKGIQTISGDLNVNIFKCIIPKGSTYFVCKWDQEICSDNLIIESIMK